ncbi:MAG: HEAT repeat domain-containing protein [Gemmatimonadota bacterium]
MMRTSTNRPFRFAALALVALCAGPLVAQEGPPAAAELSAPAASGTDDATYAHAVELLDTALVRPARADQIALLRPQTHLLRRMLAAIAMDERAPVYARGNSLLMLGNGGGRRLDAFAVALDDESVDVRAAAAVGLGSLLEQNLDARIVALLRRALRDESQDVQVRALEALADNSPDALREYLAADPAEPLRGIAETMVSLAEHRGAPLATGPAALETLSKTHASGARLVFQPVRSWPEWEAALGELRVEFPDRPVMALSEHVEVVGGVIPALFAPDGSRVVYETARTIVVVDLEDGTRRSIGEGIAPRPYPLRDSFVFFRAAEQPRQGDGGKTQIRYDVIETPLGGGDLRPLGSVNASVDWLYRGNYSPVRWIRVRDGGGRFSLEGESVTKLILPDPFDLPS